MRLPTTYTTPLEPGRFYHIYNRGNNFQRVFRESADYVSFMRKWSRFIYPVAKTFAYNILPDHFHALVQIRERPLADPENPFSDFDPESPLMELATRPSYVDPESPLIDLMSRHPDLVPEIPPSRRAKSIPGTPPWVSRAFKNFFISFARTMQNRHSLHGAVFHSPFKRKLVGNDLYMDYLTAYIHYNARKHGLFTGALDEYAWSSYKSLLSTAPTLLERDYMLQYFGGRDGLIAYHKSMATAFEVRHDLED